MRMDKETDIWMNKGDRHVDGQKSGPEALQPRHAADAVRCQLPADVAGDGQPKLWGGSLANSTDSNNNDNNNDNNNGDVHPETRLQKFMMGLSRFGRSMTAKPCRVRRPTIVDDRPVVVPWWGGW